MESQEPPSPVVLPPPKRPLPKRHGCLTTVLILWALGYGILFFWPRHLDELRNNGISVPDYAYWVRQTLMVLNLIAIAALWRFRKWGFYLYAASVVAEAALYLSFGEAIPRALNIVMFAVLLYFFLRLGDEEEAWRHLR